MDLKLQDKVVLVTGGTGGIGKAIVKAFLAEGAKVAFSSTRQEKADALMAELDAGDKVQGFIADMTKEEEIAGFVEAAKAHFGTIDVVVPNAGYEGQAHPVQDMTLDLFEKTYMMNVFAPMLVMKYAAPTLIEKQSGAIVVIASAAAYEPTPGNSARPGWRACKLHLPRPGGHPNDAAHREGLLRRLHDPRRGPGDVGWPVCHGQALCQARGSRDGCRVPGLPGILAHRRHGHAHRLQGFGRKLTSCQQPNRLRASHGAPVFMTRQFP